MILCEELLMKQPPDNISHPEPSRQHPPRPPTPADTSTREHQRYLAARTIRGYLTRRPADPSQLNGIPATHRHIIALLSLAYQDGHAAVVQLWDQLRHEDPELTAAVEGGLFRTTDPTQLQCTDLGNAERLVLRHGQDLRYCVPWHGWLVWDGRHWRRDDTLEVEQRAKATVQGIYAEAADIPDRERRERLAKWAVTSEADKHLKAMVSQARSQPGIPVRPEELDRDLWLLNVLNGTLDLRTGELRPHRREALMTKLIPVTYDPRATCRQWGQFLHRIMDKKTALIDYLQRAVGYSLTGSVQEQCFFFCYGTGQNGKSTFLEILLTLVGPYGMQAVRELLMVRRHEAHPTERADLYQKRLVATVEIDAGGRLSEALVKLLTGGERVRARRMREDFWEFDPTHKFWLAANHKPVIRGTDDAIWRRPRLIPFTVKIPEAERDPTLAEKLKGELPGILRWAVEGCLAWQQGGLQDPPDVMAAGQAYRAEMDLLGQFLSECCTVLPGRPELRTQSAVLYKAYSNYAGDDLTQTMFTLRLKERGFTTTSMRGRIYWQGIGLNNPDAEEDRGGR
jgi:putative DNA primase/helicase